MDTSIQNTVYQQGYTRSIFESCQQTVRNGFLRSEWEYVFSGGLMQPMLYSWFSRRSIVLWRKLSITTYDPSSLSMLMLNYISKLTPTAIEHRNTPFKILMGNVTHTHLYETLDLIIIHDLAFLTREVLTSQCFGEEIFEYLGHYGHQKQF